MQKINKYLKFNTLVFCSYILSFTSVYAADCENINGLYDFLNKYIFTPVKFIVPVLVIILGVIDFVKATAASDEQKIKKAQKDFITRLIIGVIVFFVPSLIKLIFGLAGMGTCGIS